MASPVARSAFPSQPIDFPRSSGGILINSDGPAPLAPPGQGYGQRGRPTAITVSKPASPPTEITPIVRNSSVDKGDENLLGSSPRIRFAPLPEPPRPRSLSTGRNLAVVTGEDTDGNTNYHLELRNMENGDEHALDDDSGSDEGHDEHGRRRSWVTMGLDVGGMGSKMGMGGKGSWMGTKKLLGKPKEEDIGAPLKKSTSNGMTPTSPFKLTSGSGSKIGSLGTSPGASLFGLAGPKRGGAAGNAAHRRGNSGDSTTTPGSKVRMLNGRVYGARRASEAAAAEEIRRRNMEPAFVEWGSGQGSSRPLGASVGSRTIDDDDGGGMSWVRKRREERERREREEKEARERAETESTGQETDKSNRPASLSSSASSSSGAAPGQGPLTPHEPPAELVGFAPAIQVTPPAKPSAPVDADKGHVHAIAIPGAGRGRREADDDDEDDEYDDGDFDDDDDEDEELEGMGRFTSSAAGVEILSRHKN